MNRILTAIIAVSCLLGCLTASAATTLKVGDPAPGVKVSRWIKGKEVQKFEAGKIYVVEFWATWCPPCRKSIPHLTKLAKKFEGKVTVIGVSVSERERTEEARLAKVSGFVKDMGDEMEYIVAADDSTSFMSKSWMRAAGQNGIPTAFVVKEGKIAWIGHPMDGLEEELKKLTK